MKPWYQSRTLWANVLAVVGILAQSISGKGLDPEAQAVVLAFINIVLRLITDKGLTT